MSHDWMFQLREVQLETSRVREALSRVTQAPESKDESQLPSDVAAIQAQVGQDPVASAERADHITDSTGNSNEVFVIHGRNLRARNAVFQFLRTAGLHPLTWEEAVRLTGRGGAPTTLEVVRAGLGEASVIVVLLTPDEIVELQQGLANADGSTDRGMQPRANVILEAGMALAIAPQRTLLVRLGQTREISDISGVNFIRLSNRGSDRMRFLMRLDAAGAKPTNNEDLMDSSVAGDFDASLV